MLGFRGHTERYRRLIKDVAVQAVRNAVVHGIEAGAVRESLGKSPKAGSVAIEFQALPGAYRLTIEDDGPGCRPSASRRSPLQKRMISADQAAAMDAKQTFSLLFQAGFSMAEQSTKDAGRGVGMNLIAERAREAGGRVAWRRHPVSSRASPCPCPPRTSGST